MSARIDPETLDATLPSPLHRTVASWSRAANRRLVLQAVPIVLVLLLAAALVGRGLALFAPRVGLGLGVGATLGAGGIAWLGWRLWCARWTPAAVAARVDRRARHHDLLQTGLAIEAGHAVGDRALQGAGLRAAHAAVPACAPLAVPRLRLAPAALAGVPLLVVVHLGLGWLGEAGPAAAAQVGPLPDGVALAAPAAAEPAPRPPADAPGAAGDLEARAGGQRGAPGASAASSQPRDASGVAQGARAVAVGTRAKAEGELGIDPLAAATDIWVPGGGGGGEGGPMAGSGPKTGQEAAGSAGVRDGDLAAPQTNAREQAAGGAAPEGADASEAVEDLKTVEGSDDDAPVEEGAAGADASLAPEATGEDTEETLTSRNQPSSGELGEGRDEEMEGESGAGSAGQGGANAASGSAQAVADSTPPDWEVAAEWVETQWRQAPTGQLKAVADGQTGRRSTVAFQQIAAQYEALAEGDARPEAVPPSRRAYLTRYFDLLREPPSPPGDANGDD